VVNAVIHAARRHWFVERTGPFDGFDTATGALAGARGVLRADVWWALCATTRNPTARLLTDGPLEGLERWELDVLADWAVTAPSGLGALPYRLAATAGTDPRRAVRLVRALDRCGEATALSFVADTTTPLADGVVGALAAATSRPLVVARSLATSPHIDTGVAAAIFDRIDDRVELPESWRSRASTIAVCVGANPKLDRAAVDDLFAPHLDERGQMPKGSDVVRVLGSATPPAWATAYLRALATRGDTPAVELDACARLDDQYARILVAHHPQVAAATLDRLLVDPSAPVVSAAIANPRFGGPRLDTFAQHHAALLRTAAARNPTLSASSQRRLLDDRVAEVAETVAHYAATDVAEAAAVHPDRGRRVAAASNPNLTAASANRVVAEPGDDHLLERITVPHPLTTATVASLIGRSLNVHHQALLARRSELGWADVAHLTPDAAINRSAAPPGAPQLTVDAFAFVHRNVRSWSGSLADLVAVATAVSA
jgi:hypothetical protein